MNCGNSNVLENFKMIHETTKLELKLKLRPITETDPNDKSNLSSNLDFQDVDEKTIHRISPFPLQNEPKFHDLKLKFIEIVKKIIQINKKQKKNQVIQLR